jgi:hypothetical protein
MNEYKSMSNRCAQSFLKMALEWKHPFTAIVAGPTGCGKTSFVIKFIQHSSVVIAPPPLRILWCYGTYQKAFDDIRNVEFHEGIPDITQLQPRTVLILDDLMHEADERVNKIFTKYSHHQDVSVMFLTQNIFHKSARTMTLNSHYLVLFKNPRDATQITYLARQMYPTKPKFMIETFADATKDPYTYLVVDLKADTPDEHRLRSGIFPDDVHYVYIPK